MLLIVVIVLVLAGTIVFTAYRTSYRPERDPSVGNFVPSDPERESSASPSVRPPRPAPSKPRMPIRTASRTSNRPRHTIPNYTDDDELYAPGVAALDRLRHSDPVHEDSPSSSFDDSPSHDNGHSHDSHSHDSGFDSGGHDDGGGSHD